MEQWNSIDDALRIKKKCDEYIVHNDMSVLQEAPFTDRGSIVEVFTDISVWLGIKNIIDRINANAA